ncbi:hypothetical protein FG877_10540 [Enterococcus casseliflavus]|nr:hypothetical protein [Enterococcus casseliflavus]
MKRKKVVLFIFFSIFLLGYTSLAHATEGKSSIQFYMENIASEEEDEDKLISDEVENRPEKNPETEKDTSGVPQTQLPQTNFRQSRIMGVIGSILLIFILFIIKERRKKNEKK